VLSDPEKRKKYDQLGANWNQPGGFQPPPDGARNNLAADIIVTAAEMVVSNLNLTAPVSAISLKRSWRWPRTLRIWGSRIRPQTDDGGAR